MQVPSPFDMNLEVDLLLRFIKARMLIVENDSQESYHDTKSNNEAKYMIYRRT